MSGDPWRRGPGCNPFGPFLALALQLALWRGKRRRRAAARRRPPNPPLDGAQDGQEPPAGSAAAPGSSWRAAIVRPLWTPRAAPWRSHLDMWADSATVDAWLNMRQLEVPDWITGWQGVTAYRVALPYS